MMTLLNNKENFNRAYKELKHYKKAKKNVKEEYEFLQRQLVALESKYG